MPAPEALRELVAHFRENQNEFKSSSYNEARLRREFIDPFFELLGWDVQNRSRYAEAYKDVIHEDAIRIGGSVKAPDYAFRIGGVRKFFLEAKKPSVNIKNDAHPAFQLRRYAWSSKLPLSILTDFEELAVYDCRVQPNKADRSSVARTMYLTFEEYEDRWDELSGIFSREAILKGSFDRYAEDNKKKKGTAEVDDAFLAEIELWREQLAANIASRNRGLDARQLNKVVQQIIDRIVFLRIAEDRGFEPYGTLQALATGKDAYSRLGKMFIQADRRYNSGLFHFKKSPDVKEDVDDVSLALVVDDKVIKDIVKGLYYPDSPYEFSVLPADILGQVYEQFLGRTIDVSGRRAVITEKPEVKKAGGVYYTPTYIVRDLVARALAPLLNGRTPAQVAGQDRRAKSAAPVRIIDPACGSGSFLIEAYQQLLDWYLAAYLAEGAPKHSRGKEPRIYEVRTGEWRLSIAERRRILVDHIFGVDLDSQAVEVTKLSLCLKILEGETKDAIARQMDLFHTRALPDLHNNIRWGNSLVSTDVYDVLPPDIFRDDANVIAINPFDWHASFPFLARGDRFDVVIGNPPYLPIFEMRKDILAYYQVRYKTYQKRFDAYALFIELIVRALMGKSSRLGLIIPSSILNNHAFSKTRELISDRLVVDNIDVLGGSVFKRVNKDTLTLSASASGKSQMTVRQFVATPFGYGTQKGAPITLPQSAIAAEGIAVRSDVEEAVLAKIASSDCIALGQIADTYQGIVTGADDVFISESFDLDAGDKTFVKPFLFGSDISEFRPPSGGHKLLYITKDVSLARHPKVEKQLRPAKPRLDRRRETLNGKIPWYALHWPRRAAIFEGPKLLVQGIRNLQLPKRLVATLDEGGHYAGVNLSVVIPRDGSEATRLALLGILNSRVANYWFAHTFVDHRIKNAQLEAIPIPANAKSYLKVKAELAAKVAEITEALGRVASARDGTAGIWATRAAAARERVEALVEDAFGLDDATRKIVRQAPCNQSLSSRAA